MQLLDWLDDLCVRFIVNLPREELESVERICFQIEEAQWFYEDFVRPLDPGLPSLNLRQFALKIFQHCPLFAGYNVELYSRAFAEFLAYKTRVPVRGAIMLNETMTETVLVKGWKKNANWSFPRGKINKDEDDLECAIREVYEETGFDLRAAGLVSAEKETKYIEVTMREQHMKLYVFPGVPATTVFEPRTRKEISKIAWYRLSELPTVKKMKQQQQDGPTDPHANVNKFYMVAPFLSPLKKIIASLRKQNQASTNPVPQQPDQLTNASLTAAAALHNAESSIPSSNADMTRLMMQLRQSNTHPQGSKHNEVAPADFVRDNLPHQVAGPQHSVVTQPQDSALISRERKAHAMLDLIRSGGSMAQSSDNLPHTPWEQISAQPTRPPATPKQSGHRADAVPQIPPPSFGWSPETHNPRPSGFLPVPLAHHLPHLQRLEAELPHAAASASLQAPSRPQLMPSLHQPNSFDPSRHVGNNAPQLPEERISLAPPANALPVPRLNAQSSALLGLFKAPSAAQSQLPKGPQSSALPSPRPELPGASPSTALRPSAASIGWPEVVTQGSSQISSVQTLPLPRSHAKQTAQQSTLLDLFRAPSAVPTASASTAPAWNAQVPVELSATTSPATHGPSKAASRPHGPASPSRPLSNGIVQLQQRPNRSPSLNVDHLPSSSATVSGPLGEPNLERLHSRAGNEAGRQRRPKEERGKDVQGANRPIKILPRPSPKSQASPLRSPVPQTRGAMETHTELAGTQDSVKGFAPQVLRRPAELSSVTLRAPSPPANPPRILTRPQQPTDARATSQAPNEYSQTLLSLFGRPAHMPSPDTRTASSVSSISENALAVSPIASPVTMKSRPVLPPLEPGLGPEGLRRVESTQRGLTSPVDKKLLLNFLDGVARQSGH